MLELYLKQLDGCFFELTEAYKGLDDKNVWKRPATQLLSVGEISGHIAYWLALRFAGEGEDVSKCKVESPLIDGCFRYYNTTLDSPPTEAFLSTSAEQLSNEMIRVHEESVTHLKHLNPALSTPTPQMPGSFTYEEMLHYTIFHVAYHTGQIYSARHLLGEQTVDN